MASKGAIIGAVAGGVALLAIVAFATHQTKSSSSIPPTPTKRKSTPVTKPAKVTPGKENPSLALDVNETASLESDPKDLLAAWGMVSPHKAYVTAIAQKLAEAGDTRAADINARVANWSGPVVYAGLIAPEALVVATPLDYAFDQIFELGMGTDFPAFKNWAAQYLKANQRTEQSDLIFEQMAANAASGVTSPATPVSTIQATPVSLPAGTVQA